MASTIASDLKEFIRQNGEWTAHNIHLGDGIYTMGGERPLAELEGIKRIVQNAADLSGRPLDQLRVLDLGCGEGGLGLEFARHGARVVCVDGREANLEKGRFVQRALGLANVEFRRDDVRNLAEATYGRFDIVLCVGLLYHLNEPDMLEVLRGMASVCDSLAIVHTHVSVAPVVSGPWNGHEYKGRRVLEHLPGEDKESAVWGSLQNDHSFWLTRSSLVNALMDVGFTSVFDCRAPFIAWQPLDHVTLAAVRGVPVSIQAMPGFNAAPATRLPERMRRDVHPWQQWYFPVYRRVSRHVPRGMLDAARRAIVHAGGLGMWWSTQRKGHRG